MRNILLSLILVSLSSIVVGQTSNAKATITFLGGNFQKDAKLEIKFNGKSIGFISKGLEIKFTTDDIGEATITTQGYNMIDALYGTPVQLKLNISAGGKYFIDSKWSKGQHLEVILEDEVSKATKNGKKIYSKIELTD